MDRGLPRRQVKMFFMELRKNPLRIAVLISAVMALAQTGLGSVERITYRGWSDCYRLSNGTVEVVVGAESGGRVLEYSLKGKNIIFVDPGQNGKMLEDYKRKWFDPDGGRFDYGPEKVTYKLHDLTWMGPWKATITGEYSLRLVSQLDPSLGVQTTREFTLDKNSSHLAVRQTMRNVSDGDTKWWFWSRTLVKSGGTMLVPLNPRSKLTKGWGKYVWKENRVETEHPRDDRIDVREGVLTLRCTGPSAGFGTDASAGWMAYARDDLFFVKRFRHFPKGEYKEDAGFTVRLYTTDHMCELEPVSPQAVLKPGESYSFTEHWWLLNYPSGRERTFDLETAIKLIEAKTGTAVVDN